MTAPIMMFPWRPSNDPAFLRSREWLVTNGLGGYASGALLGIATRRYHGLFIPNLPAPHGRTVLVPRLDEEVHSLRRVVQLGGAEFVDRSPGEGEEHLFLREFRLEWQTPVWVFEINGHTLEKRITMPYRENTVYISSKLLNGDSPLQLHIRPYISFRRHDEHLDDITSEGPFPLMIFQGRHEVHFGSGLPVMQMYIQPQGGVFVAQEKISSNVLYEVERARGYDHTADLHSPGYFATTLEPEQSAALVMSVERWETLQVESDTIFAAEQHRKEKV